MLAYWVVSWGLGFSFMSAILQQTTRLSLPVLILRIKKCFYGSISTGFPEPLRAKLREFPPGTSGARYVTRRTFLGCEIERRLPIR